MAEPFGYAAITVGIAAAFTACVDCFEHIQLGRQDVNIYMDLKLGKSTIAWTLARKYFDRERLEASFLSRGGGEVGYAGQFFASIAVQLANKSPPLNRYICEAIANCSAITGQPLRDQWRQQILWPMLRLDSISSPSSFVLVVDALDESEGEDDIRMIIQLLAELSL